MPTRRCSPRCSPFSTSSRPLALRRRGRSEAGRTPGVWATGLWECARCWPRQARRRAGGGDVATRAAPGDRPPVGATHAWRSVARRCGADQGADRRRGADAVLECVGPTTPCCRRSALPVRGRPSVVGVPHGRRPPCRQDVGKNIGWQGVSRGARVPPERRSWYTPEPVTRAGLRHPDALWPGGRGLPRDGRAWAIKVYLEA